MTMTVDAAASRPLVVVFKRAMIVINDKIFDERPSHFRRPGTWSCFQYSLIVMPVNVAVLCPLPSFLQSLIRGHRKDTAKPAEA
jgi:hypothetical protein